jgi:flagellar FliL protein
MGTVRPPCRRSAPVSSTVAVAEAPAPKGKKKLILIIAAALVVVLLGGGTAAFLLTKKKAHAEDDGDEDTRTEHKADAKTAPKRDPKVPPAYVPLDMFVVNLADRDAERYAQIGITLEMTDTKEAESIKTFLPAIRNNILMVLAHKSSAELLEREGKDKLAGEVQRAASRALGIDVPEPGAEKPAKKARAEDADSDDEDKPKKKKKAKKAPPPVALPILAVHFSNFIVQ